MCGTVKGVGCIKKSVRDSSFRRKAVPAYRGERESSFLNTVAMTKVSANLRILGMTSFRLTGGATRRKLCLSTGEVAEWSKAALC